MLQVTVGRRGTGACDAHGAAELPLWRRLRSLVPAVWLRRRDAQSPESALEPTGGMRAGTPHGANWGTPSPETHAFDAFFAEHEQPLYGYLRRMVASDEVAIELAQESFVRAWQHFDEISAYDRPGAWLFRVATNLAISHLRRRVAAPFADLADNRDEDDFVAEERFADPNDFASDAAERDAIGRALRQVPERQRAALLLRAVHGLSCDEIAQALGLSPVAARKVLSRGRERFRALYLAEQPAADEGGPAQGGSSRAKGGQR